MEIKVMFIAKKQKEVNTSFCMYKNKGYSPPIILEAMPFPSAFSDRQIPTKYTPTKAGNRLWVKR